MFPDICECVAIEVAHTTLVISLAFVSEGRKGNHLKVTTFNIDKLARGSAKSSLKWTKRNSQQKK
jgi:hypothetical protein